MVIEFCWGEISTHSIHAWYIYLYISHKHQLIVGKYTIHRSNGRVSSEGYTARAVFVCGSKFRFQISNTFLRNSQVGCPWNLVTMTIVSKLVYFTYLLDVNYTGIIIHLHHLLSISTTDMPVVNIWLKSNFS